MLRSIPILVGLAILVATGIVHGLWTYRWQPSEALAEAEARLAQLPETVGSWKSVPAEQEEDMLRLAGATGHYSRAFTDPVTGEQVLVILLVGLPARMSVHRPEHCYEAVGYVQNGPAASVELRPTGLPEAELFTGLFTREEVTGPGQLRIFWSFGANGHWSAPSNPRLRFVRERVLYKLYAVRNVAEAPGPIGNDPCVRLLGELLPILDRTLWPDE